MQDGGKRKNSEKSPLLAAYNRRFGKFTTQKSPLPENSVSLKTKNKPSFHTTTHSNKKIKMTSKNIHPLLIYDPKAADVIDFIFASLESGTTKAPVHCPSSTKKIAPEEPLATKKSLSSRNEHHPCIKL